MFMIVLEALDRCVKVASEFWSKFRFIVQKGIYRIAQVFFCRQLRWFVG